MKSEMILKVSLQQLSKIVSGQIIKGDPEITVDGIGTDTREAMTGQLFFPFKGENFDAHDFLAKAAAQGAVAAVVHRDSRAEDFGDMAIIRVDDTLKAFHRLALWHRRRLAAKVIAITGSNGKTTTKEFCATLLSQHCSVSWSKKSFNNHWGVPLSLLATPADADVALIEMGMNHLGELSELCQIAEPDVVTVVFVGRSHLEGLGSIDGVAKGKEEIYLAAPESATRVFNLDNKYTREMFTRFQDKKPAAPAVTFAEKARADVNMKLVSADLQGIEIDGDIFGTKGRARVPVFGRHNLTNLMAAASLAYCAGMPADKIWQNLSLCKSTWGRGNLLRLPNGVDLLFDGYNANPESMAALLSNLSLLEKSKRMFAVLGEMKELGDASVNEHRLLGEAVGKAGFTAIWFVGPSAEHFKAGLEASGFNKNLFISNAYEESLALKMANMLEPEDIAVIKGSRGVQLERVVQAWGLPDFKNTYS